MGQTRYDAFKAEMDAETVRQHDVLAAQFAAEEAAAETQEGDGGS